MENRVGEAAHGYLEDVARSDGRRFLSPQRSFYLVVLLVIASLWSADTRGLHRPLFDLDDPYITLHNAQVLLSGYDPNYGGTHPLVGATSAIHLVLVTALTLFVQPLWALHLANWLAILLYALGLARLAFQHRASCLQAALLVAAGLLVAETPYILLNGMETGLAMAGVVWALVAATTPRPTRLLPLLCGSLPFLRPDLTALSFLLMLYQLWRRWEAARSLPHASRAAALDVALVAAVAAPWLLWYWTGTGVPYPSTIAAKRSFFAEGLSPFAVKNVTVLSALERFLLFVGTFGWCAALLLFSRVGRIGLLFCVLFIGAYYALFPGALWQNQQRYLYVLLPFLLYGAASWLASSREGPRFTATCLLIAAVAQSALLFAPRWTAFMIRRQKMTYELQAVTEWCRENLPAHARLLVHDAGFIACDTPFPLTDMVGLKTPEAIREHQKLTWTSAGRRRAEAIQRIAARDRGDYLIVSQEWNEEFHIAGGLQRFGWKVDAMRRPRDYYQVYRLTPPGGAPGHPRQGNAPGRRHPPA